VYGCVLIYDGPVSDGENGLTCCPFMEINIETFSIPPNYKTIKIMFVIDVGQIRVENLLTNKKSGLLG
jgi:hypothetical protein